MKSDVASHISSGRMIVGIGPMSQNCLFSIFESSQKYGCPIEVISSRRQIESRSLGKGYVNNWTSESFCSEIAQLRTKFPSAKVFVCRDHGGPWQGDNESHLDFNEAMVRAKESYRGDIVAGYDLLHIDPSVNADGKSTPERSIRAACELLLFCHDTARSEGKNVNFEVGTEENIGHATSSDVFESSLQKIIDFCSSSGIPKPLFVVGQTGSLVKEMRQVGNFDVSEASRLSRIAAENGVYLKEHNADYLSAYQLRMRMESGVPALNVAPEFGVIESRTFVDLCERKSRFDLIRRFINLSYSSGKWKKWLVDQSKISEYDCAMIAGHYVFATREFIAMRNEIGAEEFDSTSRKHLISRIGFYCSSKK